MVDIYYIPEDQWKEHKKAHLPLASRLFMTPEQEEAEDKQRRLPPPREVLEPESEEQEEVLKELKHLVRDQSLGHVSLEQLWDLYQRIESPRPRFIHDRIMRRLLHHMGFVEHWHEANAMQRYFQLLDDCTAEGVPLDKRSWTTAISYAGRWMRHVTADEVKAAIETWMRMEEQGHSADHVTLNVLFDVAVKAGRFALADTIYKEIKVRNMPLDRYFRGSLIYYAGMKRDGDDVRRAFREFVTAGEIVDTTVMNAVILSLLRSGEAAAAEHVFLKMKRLTEQKFKVKPPVDWQDRKELRAELNEAAQRLRAEKELHESSFFGAPFSSEERREQVQSLSPIAPDSHTYTILLQYHANTSGDVERVWQLLQEMSEQGLRPHTAAYLHMLKGFRLHGGYAFSGWNHRRLEELWRVILKEMETDELGAVLQQPSTQLQQDSDAEVEESSDVDPSLEPSSDHAEIVADTYEPYDWAADDAAQYGHPSGNDSGAGVASIKTVVPLSGIVRNGTISHDADDFDILGAMLSDHSVDPRKSLQPGDAQTADQVLGPSDIDAEEAQPSSKSRSFLDSVSLQHLTNAALLPEDGTSRDQSESVAEHGLPPHSQSGSGIYHPGSQPQKPHTTDAASSFLDSLSLRHLTDAALLPEGGTPLEQVEADSKQALECAPRYEPLDPDSTPKVVIDSPRRSAEDDNFDSQPIWRRDRFPTHRNEINRTSALISSGLHSQPRGQYTPPPGQKPVSFSSGMALEAVRAFYQCCGRERMLQVWDQISVLWHDASEQERTRVGNEVGQMERHASRYEDYDRASR